MVQILGSDHDEDILGLQDQATKALSWSTRAAVANSFAEKSSTRCGYHDCCGRHGYRDCTGH